MDYCKFYSKDGKVAYIKAKKTAFKRKNEEFLVAFKRKGEENWNFHWTKVKKNLIDVIEFLLNNLENDEVKFKIY